MNADARYVFDTNVIVSALLFNTSVPGQAFRRSRDEGAILISQPLVEELSEVLVSWFTGNWNFGLLALANW